MPTLEQVKDWLAALIKNPSEATITMQDGQDFAVVVHEMKGGLNGKTLLEMRLVVAAHEENGVVTAQPCWICGDGNAKCPQINISKLNDHAAQDLRTSISAGLLMITALIMRAISEATIQVQDIKMKPIEPETTKENP